MACGDLRPTRAARNRLPRLRSCEQPPPAFVEMRRIEELARLAEFENESAREFRVDRLDCGQEKARFTLPESSCRILLRELDGAFKLGERLAGPVDVMQQSVGAVRCDDLMAGSRCDDRLPAGGLRQLFVVSNYAEGCERLPRRPSGEFRSNLTIPSSH